MSTMEHLTRSFQNQLPTIRAEHGAVWTVFAADRVEGAFDAFEPAAEFAFRTLGDQEYLIRHTFEEPDFFPFMVVGDR